MRREAGARPEKNRHRRADAGMGHFERKTFVGRVAELATVQRLFEQNARLVTILGPGGIGKTSLVLQYTSKVEPDTPRLFCDLTDARSRAEALSIVRARDERFTRLEGGLVRFGRWEARRARNERAWH